MVPLFASVFSFFRNFPFNNIAISGLYDTKRPKIGLFVSLAEKSLSVGVRSIENDKNCVFCGQNHQKSMKTAFLPREKAYFYNLINFITMEVKGIHKASLQNMEHFQFASHVAALCEEANIELGTAESSAPL